MPRARDPDASDDGNEESQGRRSRSVPPHRQARERLEEAVCEAVFRYQLQQPLVDQPQLPRYYLALRGRDPDEALLERLRDLTPEIHPLSQCRVSAREGVVDRATSACGVIVHVARLAWVHAAALDVVGGYYITHRHAAAFRYRVESDGSQWTVTTAHLLWRA